MAQKQDRLTPGAFFHIYNRGNNRQTICKCAGDYHLFLEKWERFIDPVASTLAYNLIPNHFHAIVQIRDETIPFPPMIALELNEKVVEQAFSNFFIAFSRSMHNEYGTDGAIFKRPYQRKRITSEVYLQSSIGYVLLNAFLHRLISDFQKQPYSSLGTIQSPEKTFVDWPSVFRLLGGREQLLRFLKKRSEDFQPDDHDDFPDST